MYFLPFSPALYSGYKARLYVLPTGQRVQLRSAAGGTPAAKAAPKQSNKARWAARRKQAVAKPASKKTTGRRTVSAASRKKMAEAQRKQWAAVKKAAKAS
jgi:hypothetical protein